MSSSTQSLNSTSTNSGRISFRINSVPLVSKNQTSDLSKDIKIESYSDKSFVIYGEGTRFWTEFLKTKGKYNGRLKIGAGFIFSNKSLDEMQNWVSDVKAGRIRPDSSTYSEKSTKGLKSYSPKTSPETPNKYLSSNNISSDQMDSKIQNIELEYGKQLIQWIVDRPEVGEKVSVTYIDPESSENLTTEYFVSSVGQSIQGSICSALISMVEDSKKISKIVVCSGTWQIWGYNNEHSISFNK